MAKLKTVKVMKTIFLLLVMMISTSVIAQQNAIFNQYIFNELIINPAYAGTKGILNANAIYSSQWTGLKGAPLTQTISIEGPATKRIGLGLHLVNDRIGAQITQGVFVDYSFISQIDEKLKLSLGIALGASNFGVDGTKLTSEEPDAAIPQGNVSELRFDSKAGVFLYSDRLYAGFSISDILADVQKSKSTEVAKQIRHYYLTGGYVFDLTPKIKIKPSFLYKEDFNAPSNFDVNAFVLFNEKLWLGASVRTGARIFKSKDIATSVRLRDALAFMMELNATERLRIGYAYTLTTSALKDFPGHEFHIGYYFPQKSQSKMPTPRYF